MDLSANAWLISSRVTKCVGRLYNDPRFLGCIIDVGLDTHHARGVPPEHRLCFSRLRCGLQWRERDIPHPGWLHLKLYWHTIDRLPLRISHVDCQYR